MTIEEYCRANSSLPQSGTLEWIERTTHLRTNHARMLSGRTEGGLLSLVSRIVRPERVLELGVFTGYSTVCLAEGLAPCGVIDSIEINDELEDIIREAYSREGISGKVNLLFGDALEIIPTLPHIYDLVYVDANKRQYPNYWNLVVERVRSGGVIIADNTTWDGKVAAEQRPHDVQSEAISTFNHIVAGDGRVRCVMLPVRDGITMAVKL